jgi:tripartite-type tricarboxylate transporter receptor subunit TctC
MTLSRRQFTFAAVAAPAGMAWLPAQAQTGPAGKTVRILVGFPPGQATDAVARMVAEQLTSALGQTVIVENKPGQGGSVVLGQLARSPNDGTVMTLSALAAYTVNPHLYKTVGYDTLKDFDPVATVADLPLALVVNPSLPVKSVAELVAYAKANPTQLSHPSSGNGTLSHLLMEDFKRRAGITIQHVPYQGSAKAMTDLVGGQVQVGLDTLAVTSQLAESGKLRMLAVGTRERLPFLTAVPTIAELGYPGFEAVAWIALSAPAGTPLAWRQRINEAVQVALKSPEFQQKLRAMGAIPRPGGVEDFGSLLKTEHARWGKVVRDSGVKVD